MTGPLVTSLGHAGLRVDAPGLRLLCDPWLSPGGAFLGSWFPFPDNSHLRVPEVLDCDWVAVSHEHLDHLDLPLLAELPDRVRVVIPAYPSPVLRRRLEAAGVRHVVEVQAWDRLALNDRGDWLTVIPEASPMCHDAAILVVAAGRSIMHTNDARLSVAQGRRAIAETGGPIDFMAVQMSGASWHPICYEYAPEVVERICAEKKRSKFKAVTRLLRAVQPRLAVPYAGPPCFLDPELRQHNRWIPDPGIFPDQAQATAFLQERLPAQLSTHLMPGDIVDVASGAVSRDPYWEDFDYSDVELYLDDYAERRRAEIEQVWADNPDPAAGSDLGLRFAEHFLRLGGMSTYFLERIGLTLRFEVSGAAGGTWDVKLGPRDVRIDLSGTGPEPQYRLRLEARWLEAVLSDRMHWEDLFLSLRFSAWRSPDVYNDYLVGLLKHADPSALAAVATYEQTRDTDSSVVVRDGERSWEVSRLCPHASEDLSVGSVVTDGVLRCLGHNFDFDLATGECLNARCAPLRVRPLDHAGVPTMRTPIRD